MNILINDKDAQGNRIVAMVIDTFSDVELGTIHEISPPVVLSFQPPAPRTYQHYQISVHDDEFGSMPIHLKWVSSSYTSREVLGFIQAIHDAIASRYRLHIQHRPAPKQLTPVPKNVRLKTNEGIYAAGESMRQRLREIE